MVIYCFFAIMSNSDSPFSKSQLDLLKQFKKQITHPHSSKVAAQPEQKKAQEVAPEEISDADLFKTALGGVKKIDNSNIAKIERTDVRKKPDAKILAKRAAAEGAFETDDAELSDTQAVLNPVASQATLSYRIATLQHKVFEDLKAGNLRWFEAVDLHGCTVEEARSAVLQIIQIAKAENQNVIKIVHGKGPEAILKTYVNGWLRQHRDVLAFVSAPEKQGGTGAVLVLLKRAEKNPKFNTTS
jgi:DNA-nicking Smr family endonuclease